MVQQTGETYPLNETLRLLGVVEEGVKVRRDAANGGLDIIRKIRRHVLAGVELGEAARRANFPALVGNLDEILAIFAGHEAIFDPPAWLSRVAEVSRPSDDGQSRPEIRSPLRRPNARTRSQPPATVRQVRRKKSRHTDAWGITLPIVRKAFCGELPSPQNLRDALERAYGSEWGDKVITMTNGTREGDGMTRRVYRDDLENLDSIIKRGIAHTIFCCIQYAEGGDAAFPSERPVGPNVKKLTRELDLPRRKEEILGVLLAWGIPVVGERVAA